MRTRLLSGLALALFTAAVAAADDRCGTLLPAPPLAQAFPDDAVIVEYELEVICAGVGAVEGLPDGWTTQIQSDGENVHVRIARTDAEAWLAALGVPDRRESNAQVAKVRVGLLTRGQWSDCMTVSAQAVALVPAPDGGTTRELRSWTSDWWEDDGGWHRPEPVATP